MSQPLLDTRRSSAAIDGLRGLAALMVVASHGSGMGMHLLPGLSLEGIGKPGVYLFFVISAFLLTAQWIDADLRRGSIRFLTRYLLRRVLRIYPLYALVLIIGWLLAPKGLGVQLDGAAVWRHLSLQEGRSIYWSVPVEFTYYLMIPLIAVWIGSRLSAVLRLLALAVVVALVMAYWPSAEATVGSISIWYYLPVFVCGSLAAWGSDHVTDKSWLNLHMQLVLEIGFVAALVVTVPSITHALGYGVVVDAELWHRQFLLWGVFWASLVLALRAGWLPNWNRILSSAPMRACGRWCFGLYLLHLPVLLVSRWLPLPGPFKAWVGLAIAVAIAALAYRLVEKPCQLRGTLNDFSAR
jgi:peptidoglycan/LPS O-acetylase OafA/YrhL